MATFNTIPPATGTAMLAASVTIPVIFLGTAGDDYMNFYGSVVPVYYSGGDYLGAVFTGYAGNDVMLGSHGNDVMSGGDGQDFMRGYYGDDSMNGGNGIDTVDYSYFGKHVSLRPYPLTDRFLGVYVDLGSGFAESRRSTLRDTDTLASIENVIGSDYNDTIHGNASANVISAGLGNDYVFGWDGDDDLNGGTGNDVLSGGLGNDVLTGGIGADRIVGNEGNDTINYLYSAYGFTVNLVDGVASGGAADSDVIVAIENVLGSNFNDVLIGNNAANRLAGHAGNDFIDGYAANDQMFGGDGNDILVGGAGADHLDGGNGFDTAEYAGSSSAVFVDLASGHGIGGEAEGDTLVGVEKLVGSRHADSLRGNLADNQLFGLGGGDELFGAAGNDTLYGGEGSDLMGGGEGHDALSGEGGADALDGGAGIDSAGYTDSSSGVIVSLATGTGQGGDAEGDTLTLIENLFGSAHDDVLTGDNANNLLSGFSGNDTLDGRAGHDHLIGFDGNDILVGRAGDDMLEGGWGVDRLSAGTGNDYIVGNEGGDFLNGDLGADRFVFLTVADSNTMTGTDRINDFVQGEDLIDLGGIDALMSSPLDDAFSFLGNSGAKLGEGGLRFSHIGGNTLIEAETNGQVGVELSILLAGTFNLTEADFIL